ncbi:MAG: hypothetical protein OM95_06910 [Bdellovibrio sp. ArHS]|nr:MAG: hypothetical protein OM95_06910 [Bdellovibrio sp. ArHS]
MGKFLSFLGKILDNKGKDLFSVRLGSSLILMKLGIVGVGATALMPFVAGFLGLVYELGVFQIDLSLDSLKEGLKLDEFKSEAKKAYDHATKKVYTEDEKEKIRQDYLAIISRFGAM